MSSFRAGKATCVQSQRVSGLPYPELTTFIHILISTKWAPWIKLSYIYNIAVGLLVQHNLRDTQFLLHILLCYGPGAQGCRYCPQYSCGPSPHMLHGHSDNHLWGVTLLQSTLRQVTINSREKTKKDYLPRWKQKIREQCRKYLCFKGSWIHLQVQRGFHVAVSLGWHPAELPRWVHAP